MISEGKQLRSRKCMYPLCSCQTSTNVLLITACYSLGWVANRCRFQKQPLIYTSSDYSERLTAPQ